MPTMSVEETNEETEIREAVAAAAEALNDGHDHDDGDMDGHDVGHEHMPMPVPHQLPPEHAVHNPMQPDELEVEVKVEQGSEQQQHGHDQPHEQHHEQHQTLQERAHHMNMTLEALNASLHEPLVDFDPGDTASMFMAIKQLQHHQRQQSQVILTMRDMINDLLGAQNTSEVNKPAHEQKQAPIQPPPLPHSPSRSSPSSRAIKYPQISTFQALPQSNENLNSPTLFPTTTTTDEEIDYILASKQQAALTQPHIWPVHRLKKWIEEPTLQKIRLHRSAKHNHVPVRIPRGPEKGNKEGRLICKLCSGGKCNRNTTWMCNTCQVPLCIDMVDGEGMETHHVLWHSVEDLKEVHERCNGLLRERRAEKRRSLESLENSHALKRGRLEGNVEARVDNNDVNENSINVMGHSDAQVPIIHIPGNDHSEAQVPMHINGNDMNTNNVDVGHSQEHLMLHQNVLHEGLDSNDLAHHHHNEAEVDGHHQVEHAVHDVHHQEHGSVDVNDMNNVQEHGNVHVNDVHHEHDVNNVHQHVEMMDV